MHHTILHAFNLGAFTLEWEERKRENGKRKRERGGKQGGAKSRKEGVCTAYI